MKDEIKEILEDIKDMNNYSNFIDSQYGGKKYYYLLEKEESKQLLDYITNLQEENKNLHIQLEDKANEQIKKMYLEYKSRNEKAIEKIKKIQENAIKYGAYHDASICQDLLNILQGENKDVKD